MVRRTLASDPCMTYLHGRRITVETRPAQRAQADGELVGLAPLEVEVLPGAGRLLVPATGRRRWLRAARPE
jgi:diacylglycerol kinase family enzyme